MQVALIYNQFYSSDGNSLPVGGIETYMRYLSKLLLKLGHQPIIFQLSTSAFHKQYEGYTIYGIPSKGIKGLYSAARNIIGDNSLTIFMGDQFSLNKRKEGNHLCIQHGISWDKPYTNGLSFINHLKRIKMMIRAITDFNHTKYKVCVDYNFYNWYKTFCSNSVPQNIFIIPNFTENILSDKSLQMKLQNRNGRIRIIFARRLYEYRGSIIFAKAMRQVLRDNPNVELTIAGEGPCEQEMHNILCDFPSVHFTCYKPEDSFKVHLDQDIAVVPTIGSEGTSLSLIEAMGAGCLVLSTPIGGMSNIIIDGYNGLFTLPDEKSLEIGIRRAIQEIDNHQIRLNAIHTIASSFSLKRWEEKWTKVLTTIIQNEKHYEARGIK